MKVQQSSMKAACVILALGTAVGVSAADPYESAPAYIRPVVAGASFTPIVTTGQQIPLTGGIPGDTFRIVGIPDGMGASKVGGKTVSLLVNQEFSAGQGGPAGPFAAGARVSELFLDVKKPRDGVTAKSGYYPVVEAYNGDDPLLVPPNTRQLSRLCSAFLADKEVGFDRNIFLTGEESSSGTFDSAGPQAFATFDGATYALPRMGRAAWENILPVPGTKNRTVVFGLEDGSGIASEVYLYVGEKVKGSPDALLANGLRNGDLYVFAGDDPTHNNENTFVTKGDSITGRFEYVDWSLNAAGLAAAATAAKAFGFVRVEGRAGSSTPKSSSAGVAGS